MKGDVEYLYNSQIIVKLTWLEQIMDTQVHDYILPHLANFKNLNR